MLSLSFGVCFWHLQICKMYEAVAKWLLSGFFGKNAKFSQVFCWRILWADSCSNLCCSTGNLCLYKVGASAGGGIFIKASLGSGGSDSDSCSGLIRSQLKD
jgi:hypothetical protein